MKTSILLLMLSSSLTLHAEPVVLKTTAAFHGTSTLHDFDGTGTASPAKADWRPEEGGGVLNAEAIVFEVTSLTTDHKKRDRNMMRMFEPDTFPTVTGTVKDWKLGGDHNREAHGIRIGIHDQTLDVPVTIDSLEQTDEGLVLHCSFSLSLKACGLKRPSAALGVIRVGDEVKVEVTCLITAAGEDAE
jgi:polyisoprenoid-binding protein YceI